MLHTEMPKNVTEVKHKGCELLTAQALERRISGRCFIGLYAAPFQYVIRIGADASLWGQNNYGTRGEGHWSIDTKSGAFTVNWNNGWDCNTTNGYSDGEAIHLFDAEAGLWRTTLLQEITENELSSWLAV